MYSNNYNIVRRCMSSVLVWLTRLKTVDFLLFTVVLMAKLYIFSDVIGMSKMRMNGEDFFIELGALLLTVFWTIWLP
ncbi:LTA synthase family protein, partial [Paenibacillus sp. MCAF20]